MPRFATKAQAIEAGFTPARHGLIERYRQFEIYSCDVSGGKSEGYRFALTIVYPLIFSEVDEVGEPEWGMLHFAKSENFAKSVTVWMDEEKNRIGSLGACCEMYQPGDVESAVATAKAQIDQFYRENPAAAELEAYHDQACMDAEARQLAKAKKRAEKLAAKYGRDNLTPRHAALLS